MKKITFYLFILSCLVFSWQSNAQLTEDFEGGVPPTGWAVFDNGAGTNMWTTSTTAHAGTTAAFISWQNSGAVNEDFLATGLVDLSTSTGAELRFYTRQAFSADYGSSYEIRVSTASQTTIADYTDTVASWSETSLNATYNVYEEKVVDLSAYDGMSIYIAFVLVNDDGDSWYVDDVTIADAATDELDYYNLQWPANGAINSGDSFDVYAQAYEAGLTDVTSGQAPGIEAWIGYSTADTDPSGAGWSWVAASFNTEVGNNDEYTLDLGTLLTTPGTYYYAARWRLNSASYTYGGYNTGSGDGVWDGTDDVSGVLTVNPPAGDSCANTIDLDAETSPLTSSTAGASHDFEVDCLTSTTAKDLVYSITVPDGYRLVIGQTTNDYDSKHRLAYGASCPGDMLIACTDDPDTETLTWDNTTGSSQTAYWIQSAYTTGSGDFTLAWSVSPIPTCEMPTGLAATPAETTAAISWTASASGGAVGYNWAVMASGEDPDVDTPVDSGSIVGTSDTAINLVAETDYDLYVQTDCDVDGSSPWAGPYSFTSLPTPPINDLACSAVALTVGSGPSSGGAYSNEGATLETSEVGGSCWFLGNAASNSVWFTFMAPASGEVLISTAFGDGTLEDTQIKVYTITDCGDLSTATEVGCDEDDDSGVGPGTPSLAAVLQMSGLVSGNTYYIQVDGYGSGVGTFDIEISDPTLSVDDNEFVGFKYYPNPVNNTLTLKAQKNIESVAVYNMLGQQVMRTAPNAVTNELDMSNLATGSYFVEVSVEGVSQTVRIVKQ